MQVGDKIKVQLRAKHSIGNRKNPILLKEINCFNVDWFTFKGGKTEYRLCGDEIYAITGPERHYVLIE